MSNSEACAARRKRLMEVMEEHRLDGWLLTTHVDGFDSNGEWTYWYEWEHRDGRCATQWPDGCCTDPELEELLRAQSSALPPKRRRLLLMAVRAVLGCGVTNVPKVEGKEKLSR